MGDKKITSKKNFKKSWLLDWWWWNGCYRGSCLLPRSVYRCWEWDRAFFYWAYSRIGYWWHPYVKY